MKYISALKVEFLQSTNLSRNTSFLYLLIANPVEDREWRKRTAQECAADEETIHLKGVYVLKRSLPCIYVDSER